MSITVDYNKYKQIMRDLNRATLGWRATVERHREATCEVGHELDLMGRDDLREIESIRDRYRDLDFYSNEK